MSTKIFDRNRALTSQTLLSLALMGAAPMKKTRRCITFLITWCTLPLNARYLKSWPSERKLVQLSWNLEKYLSCADTHFSAIRGVAGVGEPPEFEFSSQSPPTLLPHLPLQHLYYHPNQCLHLLLRRD